VAPDAVYIGEQMEQNCPTCGKEIAAATLCCSERTSASVSPVRDRGREFESRVEAILSELSRKYPGSVKVLSQPHVALQNQETVIPDFDLQVFLRHEHRHYFLECQNRSRTSKDILHKIQHVRNKYWRKTFIFLYPEQISEEAARAFESEGVPHMSFSKFVAFVRRIDEQLSTQPEEPYEDLTAMPSVGR
jgi:hypothetical protein